MPIGTIRLEACHRGNTRFVMAKLEMLEARPSAPSVHGVNDSIFCVQRKTRNEVRRRI